MNTCSNCACAVLGDPCACPHCGATLRSCARSHVATTVAAAALGLMVGCTSAGDKDEVDSFGPAPAYGVPDSGQFSDLDGDGFTGADGDCDDEDADIFPGAAETAGDGVDSNCDGADDT